jgi:hypothetical protein
MVASGERGEKRDAPRSRHEIICDNEAEARAEAARRQRTELDDTIEWIYLRNKAGRWVARRELSNPPERPREQSRLRRVLDAVVEAVIDNF